jgi:hypothetical protein
MAQTFKETAHLNTDLDKYGENYERIFGKKQNKESADASSEKNERFRIKDLARHSYGQNSPEQGSEGFPEASSYVFGFMEGYKAAKEGK